MKRFARSIAGAIFVAYVAIFASTGANAATLSMHGRTTTTAMVGAYVDAGGLAIYPNGNIETIVDLETRSQHEVVARDRLIRFEAPSGRLIHEFVVLDGLEPRDVRLEVEYSAAFFEIRSDRYVSTDQQNGVLRWDSWRGHLDIDSSIVKSRWKLIDDSGIAEGVFPDSTLLFNVHDTQPSFLWFSDLPVSAPYQGPRWSGSINIVSQTPAIIAGRNYGIPGFQYGQSTGFNGSVFATVPEPSTKAIACLCLAFFAIGAIARSLRPILST